MAQKVEFRQVLEAIREGRKVEAIKLYREMTGVDLKEAKKTIERMKELGGADVTPVGSAVDDAGEARVREALQGGRKIEAIKIYREVHGVGLKEAKDAVERMASGGDPGAESSGGHAAVKSSSGCGALLLVAVGLFLLLSTVFFVGTTDATNDPTLGDAESSKIDSLHAFAKLYGYVRYFHPSDAAAATDWEKFAVHGARLVASAEPAQLDDTLRDLFAPIAPTVQIYRDREAPEPPEVLTPDDTTGLETADLELVAWQHVGIGLGNRGPYRSARLNRRDAVQQQVPSFGTVTQVLDASPYRGFEVRLQVSARAEVSGVGHQAQPWLRVDRPNQQRGFFDNMQDRPVKSMEWQTTEIVGTVADDAIRIAFGGLLAGAGSAYFDDFRLSVRPPDGDEWQAVEVPNGGFEAEQPEGARMPQRWGGGGEGYSMSSVEGGTEGQNSLEIAWRSVDEAMAGELFEARPEPGEVVEKSIGGGLMARVQLALFSRDGSTLRPTDAPSPDSQHEALQEIDLDSLDAEDESLRIADVVMAWNVFQHFYPYFDVVDADWDAVLREALRRALSDETPDDFLRTLRWMVAQLGDGHGWVAHGSDQRRVGLPIRLGVVEGEVVITAVDPEAGIPGTECFQQGDVLVSVDGALIDAVMDDWRGQLSGSPQWKTNRALRTALGGPIESAARLELRRGEEPVVCEIERVFEAGVAEDRPESVTELEGGIFYVDLGRAEMPQISVRMGEIAAAPGVIFDLRGYPQGNHGVLQHLTDQPLRSAHWQVPQQIYPDQEWRVGYDTSGRWLLEPVEPRVRGEVVFLTDGRAISYAESVMGIVEHYRLGEIVGSTTAGANGNVNPFALPGGYRLWWTGMRVVKHDGSQHHLVGIRPTVPVEPTIAGVRAGRDEVLEAAVELITSRLAGGR